METRTILQILLATVVVLCLGFGGFLAYSLTKSPETKVIKTIVADTSNQVVVINPWADKGDAAIKLVQRLQATVPIVNKEEPKKKTKRKRRRKKKKKQPEAPTTETKPIESLLSDKAFVKNILKIKGEVAGWDAKWWGETKHGPSYFLVRYGFKDGTIVVGPQWLVDLKTQKVIAKNLPALVVQDQIKGMKSPYYDKNKQIVSTIANHRFENKMSLAGTLLLYFEQRDDADDKDEVLGWTINHENGNIFKAYFQWIENTEPTYAEFEFDYDAKALKAVNLQAANMMRIGEEFERKRVSILPITFDPEGKRGSRWVGPARKQCRARKNRARCQALAGVLNQNEVIESLEWLLTARANDAKDFEKCKEERKCRWKPEARDRRNYSVKYLYRLGQDPDKSVTWDINLKTKEVVPTDRLSKLAFSVIRPR